jgi:hypothetical protein
MMEVSSGMLPHDFHLEEIWVVEFLAECDEHFQRAQNKKGNPQDEYIIV